MKNNLETFVKENREAFDTLEPNATLWNSIDSKIQNPNGFSSTTSWLKTFVFGTSVLTGIIFISYKSMNTDLKKNNKAVHTSKESLIIQQKEEKSEDVYNTIKSTTYQKAELTKNASPFVAAPIEYFSQLMPNNLLLNSVVNLTSSPEKQFHSLIETKSKICECGDERGTYISQDTLFNQIQEIEVCSNFADVNVTGIEGDKTYLNFEYINPEVKKKKKLVKIEQNKIFYEISNSKLTISIKSGEKSYINKGFNSVKQVKLNLRIPFSTLLSIRNSNGNVSIKSISNDQSIIDNSNGDVKIDDLKSELKLKARMGDLEIIHSQGKLNLEGGLGEITIFDYIGNIESNLTNGDAKISTIKGNLIINSSLGDLEFKTISGNIQSKSTSGDIKIYDCKGNLDVKSSLGDQLIQNISGYVKSTSTSGDIISKNITGDIDFTSSLGDILIEESKGDLKLKSSSGNITGKSNEIKETISIISELGDITLSLTNKMDELSFDLKTNLGTIQIDKEGKKMNEEKKMIISNGKINVKAISSSGDIVIN